VQHLEGAASRRGEQIDDGLDRFVGMMVGVEPTVGAVLGLGGLMMKAAVGEGSAQPFMKEEKEQGDLNPFRREVIGVAGTVTLQQGMAFGRNQQHGHAAFTVRLPAKHRKEVERLAQQNNLLPSIWARRALMEPGALELWNQSSPTSLVA
jgi:hypothetical protein